MNIKALYDDGIPGTKYTITGAVVSITPKKTTTGALRIAYKLHDGYGKIDCVIFTDTQLEGIYIDTEVEVTGELKELPAREGYTRGYRFLQAKEKTDIKERIGNIEDLPPEELDKGRIDAFVQAAAHAQKKELPPAEVGVDFTKYIAKDHIIAKLMKLIEEVKRV